MYQLRRKSAVIPLSAGQ